MDAASSDLFQLGDYRAFLKARYSELRRHDPRFSHRFIGTKVGVHSTGWFADLVAGRQKLKPHQVAKVIAVFKLDPKEAEGLKNLVRIELSSTPQERTEALEHWLQLKGFQREKVEKDRMAYFDSWHHLAFRELLCLGKPGGDPAHLGSLLIPPVGKAETRRSLRLLEDLGFASPSVLRSGPSTPPILVKAPDTDKGPWLRILKSLQRLALKALETRRREERNFSALTLSLSEEGLKKAGEEIAELRKRLLMLSEKDKAKDRVYQCLFQVFPLSQRLGQPR